MSSAAEEAIQRAKAIAARLSAGNNTAVASASDSQHAHDVASAAQAALASALGQPVSATAPSTHDAASSSSTTSKRKRWGVTADAAASPTEALPGLQDAAKRLKATNEPLQRRVWVETANKPASHFALYLKDGNKTQAIVSQLHPDLVVVLKGRGSSKTPPPPGMPEEPLHVLIEGPPEVVAKAETMVEDLLRQAEAAPLQQDDDLSSIADKAADALAASNPGYTPAPVAALIHGNSAPGSHYGGEMLEEQIGVPNGVVGFIIGRGGENITSMQARSGCKIQIQKEHEMTPGQTQRVITLTANSKESIDICRGLIESMVQDRIRTTNSTVSMASAMSTPGVGGSSNQAVKLHEAVSSGHVLVTVQVPDTDVGLIIGRSGTTIRSIQDRSGANIQIPQGADTDNPMVRTVSITHPHLEGAQMAKQMIEEILASKQQQSSHGPQTTLQVMIPDKDVGMCIGRSGCVIREMQNKTGTKIQIPSQSTPGQDYRVASVTGPAEGCAEVKQMIDRIVLEQSSQSVMSGAAYSNQQDGGYGGYQPQQQQQQGYAQYGGQQQYGHQQAAAGGQTDYSAEWAAYYAAQAAAQGGTASATPAPAPATAAASQAATSSGQQGADAYYEQFFRYAYYYGENEGSGMLGAWSPPPGTPNPYGTNPAGITPAPAPEAALAAPAPAPPAAAAPQSTASAARPRDTGVRGVSNLPAWMTKGSG